MTSVALKKSWTAGLHITLWYVSLIEQNLLCFFSPKTCLTRHLSFQKEIIVKGHEKKTWKNRRERAGFVLMKNVRFKWHVREHFHPAFWIFHLLFQKYLETIKHNKILELLISDIPFFTQFLITMFMYNIGFNCNSVFTVRGRLQWHWNPGRNNRWRRNNIDPQERRR